MRTDDPVFIPDEREEPSIRLEVRVSVTVLLETVLLSISSDLVELDLTDDKSLSVLDTPEKLSLVQIGRASCRERV